MSPPIKLADPNSPRARARRAMEAQLSHLETATDPAEARDRALAVAVLASADDDLKWMCEPQEVVIALEQIAVYERQIRELLDRVASAVNWSHEGERELYAVQEGVCRDLNDFVDKAQAEGLLPASKE